MWSIEFHEEARRKPALPIGFCREDLMAFCESEDIEYVLELARNSRLEQRISKDLQVAHVGHLRTGKPARVFADFRWSTQGSWSRHRACSQGLRRDRLRSWRHGEPNQRAAALPVC